MLSFVVATACGVSFLTIAWPGPSPRRDGGALGVAWPAELASPVVLVIGSLAFVAVTSHSVAVLFEGLLLVTIVRHQRTRARKRRDDVRTKASTAELLDRVVVQLQSGSSLHFSLVSAAEASALPESHGLGAIVSRLQAGAGLSEALDRTDSKPRSGTDEIVATTLEVLHRSGAAAAPALERTGDAVREHLASDADARTQSQQAMASAALIASLPGVFAVVASMAEPQLLDFYLHRPLGLICIVTSTLLTIAGWKWIEWLVWAER